MKVNCGSCSLSVGVCVCAQWRSQTGISGVNNPSIPGTVIEPSIHLSKISLAKCDLSKVYISNYRVLKFALVIFNRCEN